MKKVIKVILCSLFLGNIVQADVSWEGDPEAYITERKGVITKKDAALFLNLLEEMPWIEERARINTQRYIYVLYFPECPASQALYEESLRSYNIGNLNIGLISLFFHLKISSIFQPLFLAIKINYPFMFRLILRIF